jgi:hypothetical protein
MVLFSKTEPVYFSADRITYNRETGIVTGEGNVEIVQTVNKLQGDKVTINVPRQIAEIEGDVVASGQGSLVTGTSGVYDFQTGQGVFHNARGYDEPWYVSAEEIDRSATGEYTMKNGTLTTCAGPKPHYALKAGSVSVVPQERITARNLTLFAGPVPIFYFPYFSQNVGSTVPPLHAEAGMQSDLGAYVGISYDLEPITGVALTPHVRAFTKSGVGVGLDGKLDLFEGTGRGGFDTFYIYDLSGVDEGEPGVDKSRGTAYLFYRQDLPNAWDAVVRAEYNSDSEFLKTYSFNKYENSEPPRTYVNLERTGLHSVVSFLTRVRLVNYVEEVERLPQISLELLEQRVGDTGFFLSAGNELAYLNSEPDDIDATRNFSFAQLSYPVRWNTIELVPFLEADGTFYSDTLENGEEYRFSGSAGITAETQLQRVYESPFPQFTALRHLIIPALTYEFRPTPDVRPEDLYQFDDIDRIDRDNSLEIEVRNYLQAKNQDGVRRDVLQYRLAADLEFDDGRDTLAQIENELWFMPVPRWKLALEAINDLREETKSDILSALLRYSRPNEFEATIGVVHGDSRLSPSDTQLKYGVSKSFGPLWRAGFEQRYDFSKNKLTYQELWLWRSLDCLEALLVLRDRETATSILVLINITAFPLRQIERKIAIEPIEEKRAWPIF